MDMTTPKSPEQIMEEYDLLPANWCDGCKKGINCATEEWLRSSMASLLCYMAENGPEGMLVDPEKLSTAVNVNNMGYNKCLRDYRTLLIEEARKITNNE